MNLNDDVLGIIFSYIKSPDIILVCKEWYNIIIKNSPICSKCKKITKLYDHIIWKSDIEDINCHMYNYQTKRSMLADIELIDINPLKILFENLKKKSLNEINIFFETKDDGNFMKINELNNTRSILIDVKFNNKYFSKFKCKTKHLAVGVNVKEFNTCLNNCDDDSVYLSVYNYGTGPRLILSNKKTVTQTLRLMDVPIQGSQIPQVTFDMSCQIDLKEFENTCNGFCGDPININCSTNEISFTCDKATRSFNPSEIVKIDMPNKNKIFTDNYNFKSLLLSNCENYCDKVTIYMKKLFPICLVYELGEYCKILMYGVPN